MITDFNDTFLPLTHLEILYNPNGIIAFDDMGIKEPHKGVFLFKECVEKVVKDFFGNTPYILREAGTHKDFSHPVFDAFRENIGTKYVIEARMFNVEPDLESLKNTVLTEQHTYIPNRNIKYAQIKHMYRNTTTPSNIVCLSLQITLQGLIKAEIEKKLKEEK